MTPPSEIRYYYHNRNIAIEHNVRMHMQSLGPRASWKRARDNKNLHLFYLQTCSTSIRHDIGLCCFPTWLCGGGSFAFHEYFQEGVKVRCRSCCNHAWIKQGNHDCGVVSLQWESRNITDVDMADVSTSGLDPSPIGRDQWWPEPRCELPRRRQRLNRSNKVTKFQFDFFFFFFFKASKTNHVWQAGHHWAADQNTGSSSQMKKVRKRHKRMQQSDAMKALGDWWDPDRQRVQVAKILEHKHEIVAFHLRPINVSELIWTFCFHDVGSALLQSPGSQNREVRSICSILMHETLTAHKVKRPPVGPGYIFNGEILMLFYRRCKIDTLAPRHSELFSSFQGLERFTNPDGNIINLKKKC